MSIKKYFVFCLCSLAFGYSVLWLSTKHSKQNAKLEVLQRKSKMILAKPSQPFLMEWASHGSENRYVVHVNVLLRQKQSYFDYKWHLPTGYVVLAGATEGRVIVPTGISAMPLEVELELPQGVDEAVTLEAYYMEDGSSRVGATSLYHPRSGPDRAVANEEAQILLNLKRVESKEAPIKIMQ